MVADITLCQAAVFFAISFAFRKNGRNCIRRISATGSRNHIGCYSSQGPHDPVLPLGKMDLQAVSTLARCTMRWWLLKVPDFCLRGPQRYLWSRRTLSNSLSDLILATFFRDHPQQRTALGWMPTSYFWNTLGRSVGAKRRHRVSTRLVSMRFNAAFPPTAAGP